jgi:WD40 repeat protein
VHAADPSSDAHVYVWHKDSGGLLEVLEGHNAAVTDVAWNPVYPNLFASCSDDYTVYVLSLCHFVNANIFISSRLWQPPSEEEGLLEKWGEEAGRRTSTVQATSTRSPVAIDVDMIIA